MEARELRVGNLVKNQFAEKPIIIKGSDINDLSEGMDSHSFQPIPLTEEWHNKFGIKKNRFGNFVYEISKRQLIIFNDDHVFLRDLDSSVICALWSEDIKKRNMFLHEWQNLHFALTNKEL
jgi:hypothetical protein